MGAIKGLISTMFVVLIFLFIVSVMVNPTRDGFIMGLVFLFVFLVYEICMLIIAQK